jgi:hypothetical protein
MKFEAMSTSAFTHWVNSIFGRKIGTMDLRRAYISDLIDNGIKIKDRKKIANDMGHNIRTQSEKYGRYAKINN